MANGEAGKTVDARGGVLKTLVPLMLLTLLGGGGGAFLGGWVLPALLSPQPAAGKKPLSDTEERADAAHGAQGKRGAHGAQGAHGDVGRPAAGAVSKMSVVQLPPVIANLAGSRQLVRLQSAIVFDPLGLANVDSVVAALRADVAAFLSTLDLASIEGPDGLRRLQEELSERSSTRSGGHVREFIIETLVVQ